MLNITDHSQNVLTDANPLLGKCRAAVARRLARKEVMPPLNIDPLSPLPLADAAPGGAAVKMVYFILASRKYAHDTINRNVHALQKPGALNAIGSNDSNLFLIHADAKLGQEKIRALRAAVLSQPDDYRESTPFG